MENNTTNLPKCADCGKVCGLADDAVAVGNAIKTDTVVFRYCTECRAQFMKDMEGFRNARRDLNINTVTNW